MSNLSKFHTEDIVRYKKDGRLYVIWTVDASGYSAQGSEYSQAFYQIMPKAIYDRLDPEKKEGWDTARTIDNVPERDLELIKAGK
jgi:hypothetical protein